MGRVIHVVVSLAPLALAVRRLDLTSSSGETAGSYAFPGGEEEATCKACKAVIEHIERKMAEPMWDETGYFAGRKTRKQGTRAVTCKNKAAHATDQAQVRACGRGGVLATRATTTEDVVKDFELARI